MTRRKVFIAFAAAVMILVLTAALFVACDQTKTYTVTFKDGDTVIATATVKDGEKIAASDIPANLADTQDAAFEGWFNGDSAFDKDAAITASVTYNAKWTGLFNVTFMNGDTQVKSVKVKSGEKIADADIPSDPAFATPEYAFGGWFNGEVEFDENATVDSNVVYTAKWNKVAYVVTFKNGDEVVKTSYIEIAEGAKLTAEDLADAATKADSVFLGYYDGIVKAAADLQVTADRTFVAEFANEETYAAGYWINTEEHKMLTIKSDKKVTYDKFSNKAFKYDAKTGTMKYSDGFGYSKVTYTITVIGDHAVMTESGFEYEEPYSKDTILEKKADAGLAAFYTMGRNKQFIVEDNGIISGYGSNAFKYGWFYTETVDGKTVYHFDFIVSTTLVQKTATVDANGNYVVTGSGETSYNGIYGKDVDGITYYGDSQYIYGLVGETSTTYVYVDANKDSHYATISGELAANSIITVSYGEGKSVVLTITKAATATADGSLKQASSERGTYNGDKGAIFLDGFGKATVDGAAYSYYINGANVVVLSNETATIGVTIDTEIGVYLEKTADGKAQLYKQNGSTSFSLQIDGFGGATGITKYSWSSTASYTYGTYEFSSDGATVTIAKVNSSVNGTYNIQDSGKVLVESTSERKVFIADGYTVTTHEQEFVAYYVDANGNAIEITIDEDGRIWLAIAGTNKRLTKNWNGTVLTYTAKDDDAAEGYTGKYRDYKLTLVDGNVVISHDCIQSFDGEEFTTIAKSVTYTKTEKPFAFPESARGTWYLDDNTVVVIAEKSITVGGVEGADYNVTESFGTNYEFTIGGKKYMVYEDAETAGKWYYCAADSYDAIELSKTEHAATLDAFAGSWTRTEDNAKKFVFTFNGEGTLTLTSENSYYNGKTAKYTIVDNKITLSSFVSYDWTFTLTDANTIAVTAIDSDGYTCPDFANGNITKQVSGGAAVSADLQGTYTGTNGYTTNYTLIVGENSIVYKEVDSSWGVNINDTITDYTISEDGYTITWTKSGTTYKFMDTGFAYKLYVGTDDYTLTKQA